MLFSAGFVLWLFGGAVVAGIFGALLGIGGGLFIVPMMVLGFHLPMRSAVAASIVAVIATSNAGGSSYVDKRIANLRLGMFLEIFTTFGALGGAALALHLSEWLMLLLFSALLLYMAYGSFTTRNLDDQRIAAGTFAKETGDRFARWLRLNGSYFDQAAKQSVEYKVGGSAAGALFSLFAGIASGLLGVGGGVLKVSGMNRYMNVPMKVAVGTSKLMIGITAAVSSILFLQAGLVQVGLVGPVALGTTVGATFGTRIMNRLKSSRLKAIFTFVVLYMAYSMIAKALEERFQLHLPHIG